MKYMIASDIHGSAFYCRAMLDALEQEQADRLMILGDILYHGPRNDLPKEYAPKKVIEMLNQKKDRILAIRGNCDAAVDQMVLAFPILAEYAVLEQAGHLIYASHGHVYHEGNLPPLQPGDVFLYGHTHVLRAEEKEGIVYWNPGSVSIPKEGNPPTYAILEQGVYTVKTFAGAELLRYTL